MHLYKQLGHVIRCCDRLPAMPREAKALGVASYKCQGRLAWEVGYNGANNFIQDPTGIRSRSTRVKLIAERTALAGCRALRPRRR